jgi:ParB family chromosome partitioning protein
VGKKNNLLNMLTEESKNNGSNMLLIDSLIPYSNHPFSLYEGERLDDMVESIKANGILLPIIVRPTPNGAEYEILSGHNRVNAARIAELIEVPAIIKIELSDDDAELIVTETNLIQRSFSDLKHSERARSLKSHFEALKSKGGGQGRRSDLINEVEKLANPDYDRAEQTSAQIETKLRTDEQTADKYGLSRANVARYIRLSYLVQPLLEKVDKCEIAVNSGVELSHLSEEEQEILNFTLDNDDFKVSLTHAKAIREKSRQGKLTGEEITAILSGEKTVKKPKSQNIKISPKSYLRFFDAGTPQKEIVSTIEKALEFYFKQQNTD